MISVAAFTGGKTVPSARFRVRQYIEVLSNLGIEIEELSCAVGKYPPRSTLLRPLWLVASLVGHARNVVKLRHYDVVLLQREMISKLITFERWLGENTLLDVDDAIFMFRNGHVARCLAKKSSVVVCGNTYLAEIFSEWNSRIHIIPTAVDTEKYQPADPVKERVGLVVGWIGTSGNLHELAAIEGSIAKAISACPGAKLRVVSDAFPVLKSLSPEQFEFLPWSEAGEVRAIQEMDIGIMPLRDSAWTRGKCAFKMIQYMACGLPSVVSPVGMNAEVLAMGDFSLSAQSDLQWTEAIVDLLRSADMRRNMGGLARQVAERTFSVKVLAPRVAAAIQEAAEV